MKVGILVVTYETKPEFEWRLERAIFQINNFYLVRLCLKQAPLGNTREEKIRIVSETFNSGIEELLEEGCEYIIHLHDDVLISSDFLEKLLMYRFEFVVTGLNYDSSVPKGNRYIDEHQKLVSQEPFNRAWEGVEYWMISRKVFLELDKPYYKPDFNISEPNYDFAARLKKLGYSFFIAPIHTVSS